MRPGLLVTITIDGANYILLFLHLASSSEPRGMGLRDDMLYRAVKFRHVVLDKAAGGKHKANYIFLAGCRSNRITGDNSTVYSGIPRSYTIYSSLFAQKVFSPTDC